MLRTMTIRDLYRWRAYYAIDPFGMERADANAASITSTLMNIWRKRGTRRINLADVMIQVGEPERKKKVGWERLKAIGRMIATGR